MRVIAFAAFLFVASTAAHAEGIPFTISGTENTYAQDRGSATYHSIAPELTLTGSGSYDVTDDILQVSLVGASPGTDVVSGYYDNLMNGPISIFGVEYLATISADYNPKSTQLGGFSFEVDYQGGYLDSGGGFHDATVIYQGSGSFQEVVTPEPSSIALFATGCLGTVGMVRRRRASYAASPAWWSFTPS